MGMVFWLLLAALLVWQLCSSPGRQPGLERRAHREPRRRARGGDPEKAARNAVSGPLRAGFHDFRESGEQATVHLRIPILLPGLTADGFTVTRSATLPADMGLRDRIASERNGAGGTAAPATASPTTASGCSRRSTSPSSRRCRSRSGARGWSASSAAWSAARGRCSRTAERTRLIRQVIDEAIGLGVLEPLLADPTVTEIMVNGTDEIYVERDGRLQRADIHFTDEAQLYQTIDRIVSQVNRRVDESSPMVDARLPTGERVNVIIPPLALHGPTITIRRFPRLFTLEQLVGLGSLDAPVEALLRAFVRAKLNVVISGGTGAGKTTLLNALSAAVPASERIITVEDNAELRLQQPHVVSLEARPSNVEGRGEITIRDLVRNSLRMRPDRIIVGEVRGGGDARHAPGAQHGPRGLAGDRPRELLRRRDPPARDAGDDERPADPVRGAARPDQLRDRRDRADRPLRRRPPARRRGRGRRVEPARDVPARDGRALRQPTRSGRTGASPAASSTSGCPS